ncbi:MAG: hypothetical protein EZS28_031142, partial [Streblomastix strix]
MNGLRVIRVNLEREVAHNCVFEVISGELSLIDIHIKDINITQKYNENNSLQQRRRKKKGLIEIKEKEQDLCIEKSSITNVSITTINKGQRMIQIMVNVSHLKLRDRTFLGKVCTSIRSAIRAYPTDPNTIDVEEILFKGQRDGQRINGCAVYVDMRDFD